MDRTHSLIRMSSRLSHNFIFTSSLFFTHDGFGFAISPTLGAIASLLPQPPEFNKCPHDYKQQTPQKQKAKKGIPPSGRK